MRRFIRWRPGRGVACVVAAAVMSSAFAVQPGAGAQAGAEQIDGYDVAIAVQHDASILVTERIVYDFGGQDRHGIIREIPVLRAYNKRYDRYYPVDVRSVQSPDAPAQYTVNYTGDTVTVKIGDPGQTVTGVHTYQLTYLVSSGMDGYADHDELYWDAIGDRWEVPIRLATVRVTTPAAPTRVGCWAGPHGSVTICGQAEVVNGAATFTEAGLVPYEGLTVAVSIPKGVIATPHPVLRERASQQQAFALTPVSAGASGTLLVILVILGSLVVIRGRRRQYAGPAAALTGATPAPRGRPAPSSGHDQPAPEPAPPGDLRPGQAGTLLDGIANNRDVTGTIVDLAVRGYLVIEETGEEEEEDTGQAEDTRDEEYAGEEEEHAGEEEEEYASEEEAPRDWRLVRLGKTGGLLDYEQILLDGLFMNAATDTDMPSVRLSELGSDFAYELERAQDALYADVTDRGWFVTRPDWARRKWRTLGGFMFVGGMAAVIMAATTFGLGLVPIPVALAGLILIGAARWMPLRTAAGTAMARRVEGFRRYITSPAAARAHPAGPPGAVYDYLPYAIALGCTRRWAELTDILARTSQPPSWYQVGERRSPAGLPSLIRPGGYCRDMHHFATATNDRVSSAGSDSGGSAFSGGSGFSSGGFSGGGGGGGGGGSW